jgi:hypothetical protein
MRKKGGLFKFAERLEVTSSSPGSMESLADSDQWDTKLAHAG